MDMITLAAARKYVNDTASALGAVKGSPCTIKSITETDDGATVVFSWTGADNVEQTSSTFLPRGPQGLPGEKGDPGAPGKDGSGTVDTVAREQITALTEEKAGKQTVNKVMSLFVWDESGNNGGTVVKPASSNLLNPVEILEGKYITPSNGAIYDNASYSTTGYIPVNAGDIITFQADYDAGSPARQCREFRFLAAFDENKQVVADAGSSTVLRYYTVPDGISFIRFSWISTVAFYNLAVNKIDAWDAERPVNVVVPYEEYYEGETVTETGQTRLKPFAYAERSNGYIHETGDTSWTGSWENHDMSNFCWNFRGNIPNGLTNGITVGKGSDQSYGAHIKVDATKVYYYIGKSETPYNEWEHGLTLKDYIMLEYRIGFALMVSIKLITNGGTWEQTSINGDMRRGRFYVENASGEVVNGRFSYYNKSWEAPNHVYGDSYLTFANTRWLHYMREANGANIFLNGFPGRGSVQALAEVKQTMQYAKRPERIVWLLGMNDGDKNGVINAAWLESVEELMEICEEQGIELILSTIPNVPTVDNTYKNAYVRESGYRYIDCAAAVGAADDTTWYDGMLCDDGVHPDVQGGLALYAQTITDVPELLL